MHNSMGAHPFSFIFIGFHKFQPLFIDFQFRGPFFPQSFDIVQSFRIPFGELNQMMAKQLTL
jgi:hypothetical protein